MRRWGTRWRSGGSRCARRRVRKRIVRSSSRPHSSNSCRSSLVLERISVRHFVLRMPRAFADFLLDSAAPPNRDVTSLTEALQRLTEDGSQLIITRRLIPQGVSRLAGGVSLLAVEDHAILTHAFQVVGDLSGLLQVRLARPLWWMDVRTKPLLGFPVPHHRPSKSAESGPPPLRPRCRRGRSRCLDEHGSSGEPRVGAYDRLRRLEHDGNERPETRRASATPCSGGSSRGWRVGAVRGGISSTRPGEFC